MNINNIIYLAKLMDEDIETSYHKPMEQEYFKIKKPNLVLAVDNTKRKPIKRIGFDTYLDKNLKDFFEFLFDKADV